MEWYPSASVRTWDLRILQNMAPVWQGDYHIRDRRDIELLRDYTTVSGTLYIDVDDLTNLEGIENLTSVGSLDIQNNDSLTSLSGLQNITSVNKLWIRDNDALTSLSGPENLATVSWLDIRDNGSLTSLSGLEGLASVGWFDIENNYALTFLGMTGLHRVDSNFIIINNIKLCGFLADQLRNQVLASGDIGGTIVIRGNKYCITP